MTGDLALVHVVVVNWNGLRATRTCLRSLLACVPDPSRVHVVDNGSADGSVEALQVEFPGVDLLALPENRGFAGGANAGMRRALDRGARFVFLMNNDATLDAGAIPAMLRAAARRPEAGLFGGRVYADREADVLWCCGVSLGCWPNLCRLRGHGRRGRGRYLDEEAVGSLTGCGLLVRREVLETVGLLDETWFVYVEDADYCARARAAGWASVYVPDAVLEHAGAGSTGGGYSAGRKYLTAHGSVLFLRRHGTPVLWAGFIVLDVLGWPLLLLAAALRGRARGALAKGRGMLDGLLGRPADRSVVGPATGRAGAAGAGR